ncbi:MAG: carbohydrate-binding domain-containing protein, partial [Clostridia bacterium]|nr:carbohydrate-binding domain-containing protein [Clostridia bacterium]
MKRNPITRALGILLSLLLLLGAVPVVSAQNVIGMMSASYIRAGEDVVLFGDTTLVMDQDLTVPSIQGDYHLTIEGSGKLTVNGGGNGIDVKSLHCTSDLFIQTGWHAIEVSETVYIQNADSFIVGGIYAGGHIDIRSNNATIAGNGNAIFSSLGNITLSGGTFDIGANGIAVAAETGGIYMTGAFTVNSNNGRTIDTAKGEVVIDGSLKSTSGAQFDPEVHFANRDWFSIGAASGFSFYGTTLEVTGLGGILAGVNAGYSDISITADSVSIITERYYALYGNYIYVDSDELWLENEGSEENENVIYDFDTVYAEKDVTLSSESGGIVGEIALTVFGTLTLNGNFVAGGDSDHDNPLIIANRMEANGNLVLRNSTGVAVDVSEGFSFNGQSLSIEAPCGIYSTNGDVNITADSTEIIASSTYAIRADDYIAEKAHICNVYIDSDYLDMQSPVNYYPGSDDGFACIDSNGAVTIHSEEARLIGHYGIRSDGDIALEGNVVAKGLVREAIYSKSRVEARGKLSLAAEGDYGCLTAQEFMFNGTTLTADGYAGIWGRLTEIHADSVVITTEVGAALDGDEVYVIANYLWAENKATKAGDGTRYGIAANSRLALTVKGGTVIGYNDALHVYDENEQFEFHYIYVNGHLTAVSQTGVGMYAPQGTVELYGGPIVSVGESHGIHAKDVIFEGGSLRVEGDTGIYAIRSVKLTGDDINITAFNERRSGIWVENGHVDLKGKVVIETNGWYGINADTHVSFEEGYYQIIGPKNDAQAVKAGGFLYLDGTLEIIQPDGGHVNGNEIYGAGDSPALEVEIYSAIRDVSLLIDGPRDGQLPDRNASDVYFLDPRCTVESIVWYEDGEEMVSQDALFRAG